MDYSLRIGEVAALLTGKADFLDGVHNAVVEAINARLAEVAERSSVSYRF